MEALLNASSSYAPEEPARWRTFIIDDNVDTVETICALFTMSGHECRFAHTGRDAIEQVPMFEPDLVVSNLSLPDLDGCEVARRLQATPNGKRPYFVAYTGWNDPRDLARTRIAGFDEHIVKPATRRIFESVVARAEHRSLALGRQG
jgi:CheY-like chemotaxis protein